MTSIGKNLPLNEAIRLGKIKIEAHVTITASGCWEWQKFRHKSGYGATSWRHESWRVHRLAYRLWKGEIPKGIDVCHACDNPPCCNPEHLWLGDQRANSLDIVVKGRNQNLNRTHCVNGHAYAVFAVMHRGRRRCTECDRMRQRKGYQKRRVASNAERTHCIRSHELAGDNLYVTPDGRRQCKACHRVHVENSAKRRYSSEVRS